MSTSERLFQWLPRILCIFDIFFVSLFATDAFTSGLTIRQQLGDFFMHMIPSSILIICLILAWKRELIGGILFIIIGLTLSPFIYQKNYNINHSVAMSLGIVLSITFPIVIVGILFLVSHFNRKWHLKKNDK